MYVDPDVEKLASNYIRYSMQLWKQKFALLDITNISESSVE
jgi:hypothetical protein